MSNKLKILVLGDFNVGKTTFIESYKSDYCIKTKIEHTINIDFVTHKIDYNNINKTLLFYDFSGLEQSKESNKCYFHHADGIILMFDLTNTNSMKNVNSWLTYCRESSKFYKQDDIPFIIVGNKLDLIENTDDLIPINEHFEKSLNEYIACSSLKRTNISTSKTAMDSLLDKINDHNTIKESDNIESILLNTEIIKYDRCACTS